MPLMMGLELFPVKGWLRFLVTNYQDFKDGNLLFLFFNRRRSYRMPVGAVYSPGVETQIKGDR